MKNLLILLCCLLLLSMLPACSGEQEDFQVPVNFYYCNKEISYNTPAGVIQSEVREGKNFHNDLEPFLSAYLKGPVSTDLRSLIPSNVSLVSCEANEEMITIVFSAQFAELSGIELSTVSSALLMTVYDYTGVETLKICVTDRQLDDKDEITLTLSDIELMDTTVQNTK